MATCIVCLIYTISMHFSNKNTANPSIYAKHMKCNYFSWLFKFKILTAPFRAQNSSQES